MIPALIGVLGAAVLAAFGWLFNLGNRVTTLEAEQGSLPKLINSQFEGVNSQFEGVRQRLDRLEQRMDNLFKA